MKQILTGFLNILLIPYHVLLLAIKKIAKCILREEFKYENRKYDSLRLKNSENHQVIEKLEKDNKELSHQLKRINYLLNDRIHKNSNISYEKTKKGIEIITAVVEKDNLGGIEIEIFNVNCNFYAENRALVLWCKRYENEFFINDIWGGEGNGHGEVAMTKLFEIAKREKINKISGQLVPTDFENRDRQISFYEKMGFKISLDDDRKNGYIERQLIY